MQSLQVISMIVFGVVTWWNSGSALDSQPDGTGFESRGGHLSHCIIPLSKELL